MTGGDQHDLAVQEVAERTFVVVPADWPVDKARRFLQGLAITHVIVRRTDIPEYYYLHTVEEMLAAIKSFPDDAPLYVALNIHESTRTPSADAHEPADKFLLPDAPVRVVITDRSAVVGFLDATVPPGDGGTRRPVQPGAEPGDFDAYPSLNAPTHVAHDRDFDVFVGFRGDADRALEQSGQLIFRDPHPGEVCQVVLVGDGIALDRAMDTLPLDAGVQKLFTGRATIADDEATITAQYIFRNQLVGVAKRRVAVGAAEATPSRAPNPCRLAIPDPAREADLTVTVRQLRDGTLHWTILAPRPARTLEARSDAPLEGAREFASDLIRSLRASGRTGRRSANLLDQRGKAIARLMPGEFFATLREVHRAIGRVPTLLLLTNEPYIPWELARVPDPLPDPDAPRFLAAQAQMGRWLEDEEVLLPPAVELDVARMTAVASQYGWDSGLRELTEAVAERATLAQRWGAIPLEATMADIDVLLEAPRAPGHLIHFAVHGSSRPDENEQALLLADQGELLAENLTEVCGCGETPRFAFVFLNACQVGTGGQVLGQAGGFPAILIRAGTAGFVAPLWEVDDAEARGLAESFYERTLADNQPIGGVLLNRRRAYRAVGSVDPLAYIYYGHPALRLRRIQP